MTRRTWKAVACAVVMLVSGGLSSCASEPEAPPAGQPAVAAPSEQVYRGCVGQTGDPDVFLLTVSEGRDATLGTPAGTVVPQSPTELPPGSPRPEPRVATEGLPGKGPDPTHKILSYRLVGSGGLPLAQHVGHTVEVTGDLDEVPQARRPAGDDPEVFADLRVRTARHLSDECEP